MRKLRIYVDTSVIGGCLDEEFKEDSIKIFHELEKGKKTIIVSDVLLFELEGAPDNVRNVLRNISPDNIEYVSLNEESIALADRYIREGAVAKRSISDARHIAISTVERVNVFLSWNFKHIVNINRIHKFNSVNLKLGYPLLEIRSPKEVLL